MKRHKHNLSHYRLSSFDMGQLVPVGLTEILPGDSLRVQTSALIRTAPLVAPVMHPVSVRIHHWFVPNRLLWAGWEDFISGKNTDDDVPTLSLQGGTVVLSDHLGLPTIGGLTVSALPFRAYNLIWNEFYRDQDLSNLRTEDQRSMAFAAWEKDYFTICRPEPQQGEEITIPFNVGTAPVIGIGSTTPADISDNAAVQETDKTGTTNYADSWQVSNAAMRIKGETGNLDNPQIYADLSQATGGMLISDWRESMARQRFAEARNRYGSRYTDYLRYLGVKPSDARINRPEYLGGGKQTISFSEVLQTAPESSSGTSVGELSGHGIAALRTRPLKRFFEEHGYMLTLMSARPKTIYMDHIPRTWLRRKKDDYWQRENEIMGDQIVTNKEIWGEAQGTPEEEEAFGFVPRHDDYRRHQSQVSGDFRESQADFWHMARKFDAQPVLNDTFITCDPTDRIYADTNEPELKCMIRNKIAARRLVGKNARF